MLQLARAKSSGCGAGVLGQRVAKREAARHGVFREDRWAACLGSGPGLVCGS